jgi:hypothetical protein
MSRQEVKGCSSVLQQHSPVATKLETSYCYYCYGVGEQGEPCVATISHLLCVPI